MTTRRTAAFAAITALSATAFLLAGCSSSGTGSDTGAGDGKKQVTIDLVRELDSGDFYQQYLTGVQAQAKALDVKLNVLDAAGDDAKQATLLESAIAQKPDAIIIDHGLTDTLKPVVAKADAANIPVVAFDVDTGSDKAVTVDQDDAKLASTILDELKSQTGGQAKVIYAYVAGFAPLDKRNAVWEQFKKDNPGITQLAKIGAVDASTVQETADQAKAALQAHPDANVIFAPYDDFAKGATIAVNELKLQGKVKVFGADISNADIQVLTAKDSPWVATAATDPSNVGKVSVRAAYLKATGQDVPQLVEVPAALVTQKSLLDGKITTVPQLVAANPDLTTDTILPVTK